MSSNGFFATVNEIDTNKHYLDLSSISKKIMAIHIKVARSGTGQLYVYPDEGATYFGLTNGTNQIIILKRGTNRLQYNQTVGGDSWSFYNLGFWEE